MIYFMEMLNLFSLTLNRFGNDKRAQDLIEYALMAGFVAVAAGAIMPNIAVSISTIFSEIASVMTGAASQS
jgi:Flp pilus assembly pilin Flp